jgi:hypothetical protein
MEIVFISVICDITDQCVSIVGGLINWTVGISIALRAARITINAVSIQGSSFISRTQHPSVLPYYKATRPTSLFPFKGQKFHLGIDYHDWRFWHVLPVIWSNLKTKNFILKAWTFNIIRSRLSWNECHVVIWIFKLHSGSISTQLICG